MGAYASHAIIEGVEESADESYLSFLWGGSLQQGTSRSLQCASALDKPGVFRRHNYEGITERQILFTL